MKVVFNERAVEDFESIYRFIAADSPHTARAVVDRIVASVERLASFPEMARKGRAGGTREWVIPRLPYIAVYTLAHERGEIVVTGIFHGARDREPK